jgi:hypothetical protein
VLCAQFLFKIWVTLALAAIAVIYEVHFFRDMAYAVALKHGLQVRTVSNRPPRRPADGRAQIPYVGMVKIDGDHPSMKGSVA